MRSVSRLVLFVATAVAGSFGFSAVSRAAPTPALEGTKALVLHTNDGKTIAIGTVSFEPKGDRTAFAVHLDPAKFKEFFLSMKEFKCLDGPEIFCHVPYPYANPGTVTPTDLAWLEHSLLFFFKQPADYGAKLSNGLYYALKVTDKGLVGTPQAINLDAIASPPSDPSVPPFAPSDREDIPPGARWIKDLAITDAPPP